MFVCHLRKDVKYKASLNQSRLVVFSDRPKMNSKDSDWSLHSCTQTDMHMIGYIDQLLRQLLVVEMVT